jgi:hypothetical protein
MAIEEHGSGRQLLRFRLRPRSGLIIVIIGAVLTALAAGAGVDGAWIPGVILGAAALVVFGVVAWGAGRATAAVCETLADITAEDAESEEDETGPAEAPDESEQPVAAPGFRRLPPLEHARVPPKIAAQLAQADAVRAARDRTGNRA